MMLMWPGGTGQKETTMNTTTATPAALTTPNYSAIVGDILGSLAQGAPIALPAEIDANSDGFWNAVVGASQESWDEEEAFEDRFNPASAYGHYTVTTGMWVTVEMKCGPLVFTYTQCAGDDSHESECEGPWALLPDDLRDEFSEALLNYCMERVESRYPSEPDYDC